MAGILEGGGVRHPVDEVRGEQPAEEQDLRHQEQPHAERGRLELLVEVVEMVLQVRVIGVRGVGA